MEFLSSIDWRAVFITLAVVFILFNTFQIIRFTLIKKKAEEEKKKIDAKITAVKLEIEKTKKALVEQIKSFQK